jgi:hypothetical protein
MTRVPIPAPSIPYAGPASEERLMAWYDRLQADRSRVFRSNMILVVESGEADADLDALFEEQDRVVAEGRAVFQGQVRRMLEAGR